MNNTFSTILFAFCRDHYEIELKRYQKNIELTLQKKIAELTDELSRARIAKAESENVMESNKSGMPDC